MNYLINGLSVRQKIAEEEKSDKRKPTKAAFFLPECINENSDIYNNRDELYKQFDAVSKTEITLNHK